MRGEPGPGPVWVANLVRVAALAVFLVYPSSLLLARQPAFFEPKTGYYNARGTAVKTAWAVDRTTAPEDGFFVATLTVRGATNPQQVTRPELAKLPEYDSRFQVEDVPGAEASAGAKEVSFAYRLRPRNREVNRLPSLNFFYLNPAVKTGNPFQNARATGIDLVVTAAPRPRPPGVPLDAPDRLFALETGPRLLDPAPFTPGTAAWAALAAGVIVVPVGWYAAWRAVYPDAARAARRRRTRAARRALVAVRAAGRSPDPAAACVAAVMGYLRVRFPFPPGADTPPEVAAGLAAAGVTAGQTDEVVDFLRRCDAARFAPPADVARSLPTTAAKLVAQLEAAE
jgi:hypothetical protein